MENQTISTLKMFLRHPLFAIATMRVSHALKKAKLFQDKAQKSVDFANKLMGVSYTKDTVMKDPIKNVMVVESNMYMCIAINASNLIELHGIVASNEIELITRVKQIGVLKRVVYVGNVVDIKHAILADYEKYEQELYLQRKVEKAKWN